MKYYVLIGFFFLAVVAEAQLYLESTVLRSEVVAEGLHAPWEITWGPDDWIWFTERNGKISRLNPQTGEIDLIAQIPDVYQVQVSGMFGLALHPNFQDTSQLFVVYTYLEEEVMKEKLVRYTYEAGTLQDPLVIIDNIPAATIRNGSRIIATPDRKIIMTTGDINQPQISQDVNYLNGKTLRVNFDGSVPEDNPIPGSYVWSWGHRNAQGLVWAENGIVYSSEHADKNDDELNIIQKGKNYGWIEVQGYCDTPEEQKYCKENNVKEALMAWSLSIAPCGLTYYNHEAIPEWRNTLLLATLKEDDLRVLKLSEDGLSVISESVYFNNEFGRLRDVCVSPTGDIYLTTSNQQDTKADDGFPVFGDDKIIKISPINNPFFASDKKIVKIYPDPVDDCTTIRISSIYEPSQQILNLHIYNTLGQNLQRIRLDAENEVILSNYEYKAGIYFYHLFDGNKNVDAGKFIIR
ncbi:PQQ-dependent sugar dehydrogenase [Catalinimonas niigatensis]|uniref:PQQ-dependent sugar dehydrogenase n=1 Tax=Catalinimonas niigatensis TaxID=1397264 RepID=UPI002665CCF7|nr:PQQ-dependent sugar dehydrogenase [Catalinimonas niigatensis]WPP53329.1 PQQ-dependent sugar dehydrogenase [Catalinimonas niigatensis]